MRSIPVSTYLDEHKVASAVRGLDAHSRRLQAHAYFIAVLGASPAATWSFIARAQQQALPVVAFISGRSADASMRLQAILAPQAAKFKNARTRHAEAERSALSRWF